MTKKITHRVLNWKNYNRGLINRGNLTIWFSEDALKNWYEAPPDCKKRGRPFTYSNSYIELALTLRTLFRFTIKSNARLFRGACFSFGIKIASLTLFTIKSEGICTQYSINEAKEKK